MLLNPIGSLLEQINRVVVYQQAPDYFWFAYAAVTSFLMFMIGFIIFHKTEPFFAENI